MVRHTTFSKKCVQVTGPLRIVISSFCSLNHIRRPLPAKSFQPGALRCSDTERNVSVESLVDVPGLVLYSVEILREQILLIFMQVR